MKRKIISHIPSYLMIIAAAIVQALSLYVFILPNKFSPGGITGIAAIFYYLFDINSGYLILAMNIPLLILSWLFFTKEFAIKTAICIVISSVLLILLPKIGFIKEYKTDEPMLAAIAGGFISGIAIGILLKMESCNGGSEIIGRFIQRKMPQYNIAWFIFAFDALVVLVSAFVVKQVNAIDIIILSIIKMFCTSFVCSALLEGFKSALKFEIVTFNPDELCKDIITQLGRSVTRIEARGGYTGQEKTILICIIRKKQIASFQRILKKYPDSFAYIMNTKEVYGIGFSVLNPKSEKFGSAKNKDNK